MNELKTFENELFKVSAKQEGEQIMFDVEEVVTSLGLTQTKGKSTFVRWERVNSYLPANSPEVGKGDLIPEPLVYKLAFKASNDIAEKFQDWLAIEVIPQIRKTGSYGIDTSQLSPELQFMNQVVQAMNKQELEAKRVKEEQAVLKEEQTIIKYRLDNIDSVDTIGDLQQRLNAMIRKYAQAEGIAFGNAWRDFRQAFNTAYRTNLKARMNNYKEKHGLKSLTMPQYLSLTNNLEDAIRVADKMLNQKEEAV
jgi:prophage antirepressor-like protein